MRYTNTPQVNIKYKSVYNYICELNEISKRDVVFIINAINNFFNHKYNMSYSHFHFTGHELSTYM